jgi:hypothetical protein
LAWFGLDAEGRGQPVEEGLLRLEGSFIGMRLLCHSIQIKNVQQISDYHLKITLPINTTALPLPK